MIKNKHVLAIDFVLIVGTLLMLVVLVGYARPMLLAPADDFVTTDSAVLFEFENGNVVLIDDNLQFSSPTRIEVEDNIVVNLKPGVYYWKVEGALSSEVRQLTIESEVDLRIRRSEGDSYEVVNAGNDALDVDVYDHGRLTGKVTLDVDESGKVSGTKFVGSQGGEDE